MDTCLVGLSRGVQGVRVGAVCTPGGSAAGAEPSVGTGPPGRVTEGADVMQPQG